MNFRMPLFGALAGLAFLATGKGALAQSAAPAAPVVVAAKVTNADQTYVLGPADVVEVSVLDRKDFAARSRIAEDGTIQLPLLGSFSATGKTTVGLADAVAKALEAGGYFSKPIVKVEIVSFASRYVTVLGNFGTPGLLPVDRAYRLSEVLARVGGVRESGSDYIELRPIDGPMRSISIKTLATGDATQDPYVAPGDKIYSPNAEQIYVSGQVAVPNTYRLAEDMTVRLAIARAGGLNAQGSEKKVTLTRAGKKIKVNLETKLQAGDVIVIGERLF